MPGIVGPVGKRSQSCWKEEWSLHSMHSEGTSRSLSTSGLPAPATAATAITAAAPAIATIAVTAAAAVAATMATTVATCVIGWKQ